MVGLEPVDGFQKVSGDGVVGVYLIDNGQTIMEVEKGKLRKGNTADLIVFASEKVQETT